MLQLVFPSLSNNAESHCEGLFPELALCDSLSSFLFIVATAILTQKFGSLPSESHLGAQAIYDSRYKSNTSYVS